MSRHGWVYVLTNASLPGLVKIGYSKTSAERRCDMLSKVANPSPNKTPFELAHAEAFEDCIDAEQGSHFLLDEFRFFEFGSELFRVSVDTAKETLAKVKSLGPGGWKPTNGELVRVGKTASINRITPRTKRHRNPSLYKWLVENYDQVKLVVGDAKHPDDLEYSRVRWMWVESLPPGYKGKHSTPLGVMMEWKRVCMEVDTKRKFGGRTVIWEIRSTDSLSQTKE